MNAPPPPIRSHTAVLVAIIVAAIAVTACALVAIAYMLGWIGPNAFPPTPMGMASPAQQMGGTAPGVALLPGESLVTPDAPAVSPAATPGPTTPQYSRPAPPDPVPASPELAPAPAPAPAIAPPKPSPRPAPPPRASMPPRPVTPSYARVSPPPEESSAPLPRDEAPPRDNYCVNCGTIVSTSVAGDGWEVRVRFEDGTTRLLQYPTPPPFRNGQRVRLEDGRLVRNY
jgi:hypothetical protein